MAYTTDTNTKITEFINRVQTRLSVTSTLIAESASKGVRREKYAQESEQAYFLTSFVYSLDNTFNDWTELQIVQYIEMWTARAKLNELPYFTHDQFNLSITFTSSGAFTPTGNLSMLGYKITNLGAGTASGDAINKDQLDGKISRNGTSIVTANIPMAGFKFTGLGAGSAPGESARFEQIPTALPPSGSAGGDLGGTYPNPTVNDDSHSHAPGVSIPPYPTALPPSGAAGGVLAGTYPNPTLADDRVKKTGDSMSGDLDMTGGRLVNLGVSSLATHAVRRDELYGEFLELAGGTMSGPVNMGAQKITNLAAGVDPADAVRVDQAAISGSSVSWTSSGLAYGGSWSGTIQFRKIDGIVHLRGSASKSSAASSAETAFTLPVSYRPLQSYRMVVAPINLLGGPEGMIIDVLTNGEVIIYEDGTVGPMSRDGFFVDGILFDVAH